MYYSNDETVIFNSSIFDRYIYDFNLKIKKIIFKGEFNVFSNTPIDYECLEAIEFYSLENRISTYGCSKLINLKNITFNIKGKTIDIKINNLEKLDSIEKNVIKIKDYNGNIRVIEIDNKLELFEYLYINDISHYINDDILKLPNNYIETPMLYSVDCKFKTLDLSEAKLKSFRAFISSTTERIIFPKLNMPNKNLFIFTSYDHGINIELVFDEFNLNIKNLKNIRHDENMYFVNYSKNSIPRCLIYDFENKELYWCNTFVYKKSELHVLVKPIKINTYDLLKIKKQKKLNNDELEQIMEITQYFNEDDLQDFYKYQETNKTNKLIKKYKFKK